MRREERAARPARRGARPSDPAPLQVRSERDDRLVRCNAPALSGTWCRAVSQPWPRRRTPAEAQRSRGCSHETLIVGDDASTDAVDFDAACAERTIGDMISVIEQIDRWGFIHRMESRLSGSTRCRAPGRLALDFLGVGRLCPARALVPSATGGPSSGACSSSQTALGRLQGRMDASGRSRSPLLPPRGPTRTAASAASPGASRSSEMPRRTHGDEEAASPYT